MKINTAQNFFNKSYWVLKYAITNTYLYTQDYRMVEEGEEKEIEEIENQIPEFMVKTNKTN